MIIKHGRLKINLLNNAPLHTQCRTATVCDILMDNYLEDGGKIGYRSNADKERAEKTKERGREESRKTQAAGTKMVGNCHKAVL